jgi:hypothetical protein
LMIRISAKKSHGLQKLSIIGSSRCHRTSSNCLEAPCAVSLGQLGVAQTCGRPQNRYEVFPTSNANVGFFWGGGSLNSMNPTQFRTPNPDVPFLEVRMGVVSSFSGCKAAYEK